MTSFPILLGLDASTGTCSVSLAVGDTVETRLQRQRKGHAALLLALAEELLAEAGVARTAVDAIACTRGPGGFTGVRIGVGVAQGLALGLDRPVVPLSTLQVLAETAIRQERRGAGVLALLDARMGEVYGGLFRHQAGVPGTTVPVDLEWLGPPAPVSLPTGEWFGAGSGFEAYPDLASMVGLHSVGADCIPDMGAGMILASRQFAKGGGVPGHRLDPVYLRNRVADPPVS
ncbi:tRNA (adenosine(37)-N6)-threonylcarbamoyltransferase complex dimerization subunit type 1 TsaB [Spiribacter onubensis]|uniref:tRNA threonylcarbamoyladenosine biosynthesis protein TsaB n=1 Tax=Spiribacter onubensis TaxID=3122420 RepID=A0ABV3S6K8_9GAMM